MFTPAVDAAQRVYVFSAAMPHPQKGADTRGRFANSIVRQPGMQSLFS
jgi:hypothetical protein